MHNVVDVISNQEFRALMAVSSAHCVSIYLPTHPAGPSAATEDPIRLKNLLSAAREELDQLGMRTIAVAELLQPVEALLEDADFWAHSTEGLAILVGGGDMRTLRLAGPVEDAAVVADHLWIAPLVPFVATGRDFHVLALSENQVRLLRATRHHVTELELGAIPASLDESLRLDDREAQLQSRGADRVGPGRVAAMYHGHGGSSAFEDADQLRFVQAIDRGLGDVIGEVPPPLVLAGVEEIVSRFRNTSGHPRIVESFIAGNPERLKPQELHEQALPLVSAHLDVDRSRAIESFMSPSTPSAHTVGRVLDAATQGRVAELLVLDGARVWGSYDSTEGSVEQHEERRPGDRDLIDLTVRETLVRGGEVFAVDRSEVPTDMQVGAVLRY